MSRLMNLGSKVITDESACYVIAEVGHNHQGSLEKCMAIIDAAVAAGADAVKLQKRENKILYTRAMYNGAYNSENAFGATYGEHREFLEFGKSEYKELISYCREKGIDFFSTAFDFASADFLQELDVPFFKIASGDLKSLPLIEYVAKMGKPLFISTGGGEMDDVIRMHDRIKPLNPDICIMQCTAGYPPEYSELNLNVIKTYRDQFPETVVGFSSHDSGIVMPVVGYVLGARVVEKHFTLNRAWKGTDHAFSLGPEGMNKMVRDLKRVREALGDGVKRQYPSEKKPLTKMQKKIVANRPLRAGDVLSMADVAFKSPGDGLPPYRVDEMVGKKLKFDLAEDENLTFEALDL